MCLWMRDDCKICCNTELHILYSYGFYIIYAIFILYSFDIHSEGCYAVGAVHTDLALVVVYNSFGYGKTETEMTAGAMS